MMGDVYQNAKVVRVWLGVEKEQSPKAFKLLHELSVLNRQEIDLMFRDDSLRRDEKEAVHRLLLRSYWRRIWFMQEFLLARRIFVHCGSDWIDWSFQDNVSWSYFMHAEPRISTAERLFKLRSEGKKHALKILIEGSLRAKATDPRDGIFVLLGIADDVPEGAIPVNYNSSIAEVKRRVAVFYHGEELGSDWVKGRGKYEGNDPTRILFSGLNFILPDHPIATNVRDLVAIWLD
jgi:hypothetical protein